MKPGKRSISAEAKAFLVWRAGESVNWECSIRDLARDTGMPIGTVNSIIYRRGWKCMEDGRAEGNSPHQRDITYWIHD